MKIRIGTRGTRLAIAQAKFVAHKIKTAFPEIETEIIHIIEKNDDSSVDEARSRVLFPEIENALAEGGIDIAVHRAKDLPIVLASGTCISAVLERLTPRDVLVTRRDRSLPPEPTIGVSSPRRAAGVRKLHPNAVTTDVGGNVDYRLRKLYDGDYDGIVVSAESLERLRVLNDGRFDFAAISWRMLVPAPCQGFLAIQSRVGDNTHIPGVLNDDAAYKCFETERRVLELTGADFSSPVGAYSYISDGIMTLTVTKDQEKIITDSAPVTLRYALAEQIVNEL